MNDHNLLSHVKAAVTESLVTLGWSGLSGGTALAVKPFQTAVGVREAHAYLKDFGPDTLRFALDGDYISEGRNQLEAHGVLIPKRADAATIQRMVTHFASSVDAAVGQTYARRLLTARQPESLTGQTEPVISPQIERFGIGAERRFSMRPSVGVVVDVRRRFTAAHVVPEGWGPWVVWANHGYASVESARADHDRLITQFHGILPTRVPFLKGDPDTIVANALSVLPPPYPGGVTEVLIDIAECLAAQRLNYPGDSRERYEVLWDWAVEFEAQFQAKIQAGDGPNPQDTYYEDVDDFAVAKATADGWNDNKLLPTPYASPAKAPVLYAGEQEAVLRDPGGLISVMRHHELNAIKSDSCSEPSDPKYDMGRHAELKAMGRKIVESDPDIWEPEVLLEFGVPVPPSDPATPSN